MAYTKRYAGGFFDGSGGGTPEDSAFLNAVEAALLKLFGVDASADGQVPRWVLANTRYEPGLITNANIDPAAAIAKSKLAALNIGNADIAAAAGIAISKLGGFPSDATKHLLGDGSWVARGMTRQIFTTGSGTYNTPAGVRAIFVQLWAAGGGSAGCAASGTTAQLSLGPGGGPGAYVESLIIGPAASYAYAVGAGGTGGAAGANSGNTGGDTTLGATIVVAKGGAGGQAGECLAGGTTVTFAQGGVPTGGSVGDLVISGERVPSWRYAATSGESIGAASVRGGSRVVNYVRSGATSSPGNAGNAPGGGAAGAIDTNNAAQAGAQGGSGLIVITELY